jgi:3-oxoacyl-[acyl-carrier protein] reductase
LAKEESFAGEKSFAGRAAIVTGGTRGIGRAIAIELARRGADIAFNYAQSVAPAEALKAELEAAGVRALAFQCNVGSTEAAAEMVKQVKDAFGRIDFLVNNAGITRDNLILRMKEEDWDEVIDTNLKGAWNFAKAALRVMLRQETGGSILNISSISGEVGMPGQSNYSASKAGLDACTRTWALELAQYGIRVAGIAPGLVETPMLGQLAEETRNSLIAGIPLQRIGTPHEIWLALKFIIECDYFTGRVIEVDGGSTF